MAKQKKINFILLARDYEIIGLSFPIFKKHNA